MLLCSAGDALAQQKTCLECHENLNHKSVAAWRESKHAQKNVGCADCHGSDHSTIFAVKGQVSAAVCGVCHEKQREEFDRSLHAAAMEHMERDPKFGRLPSSVAELGCMGCHQIGAHFADGSRGKCNSCHSSHSFSVAEARRPEACAQCHTGPDHPQMAMWQASKHGQLFAAPETRKLSPTCVTCHMPKGSHDTGWGLSFGQVANGAVAAGTLPPVKMRTISAAEARVQRDRMVQTCVPCHSTRFAAESLAKADEVKREADAVLAEAVQLITDLKDENLLAKTNDAAGTEATGGEANPDFVLGGDQLYDGRSPIEQRFFDMFKYHHASAFKGAYHHSPEYTHNQGFLRMKQDLTYLQNEAARLRASRPDQPAEEKPSTHQHP